MKVEYTHIMTSGDGSKEWLIHLKGAAFTWRYSKNRQSGVVYLDNGETLEEWAIGHGHTVRKLKHFTGNI